MNFADTPVLTGRLVTLEPLSTDQVDGLAAAACDGELWNAWYTHVPHPDDMRSAIEERLRRQDAGEMAPWAIRRNDTGALCGMTSYLNLEPGAPRLEIGTTWLARSAQGTGVNPEAKLLLLSRAFEELHCLAVEFRTHWHNQQSRTAIARLGAKQDGVLRSHRIDPDGALRDTVVFSITAAEWPAVRTGLRHRLCGHSDPRRRG